MNHPPRVKPRRDALKPGEILCKYCTAKCCNYFALQIDTPTDETDFDYIRWYLMHDRASIFIDDDVWYLLVQTTCKHLQRDNSCGIYQTRPTICREYSTLECEYEDDYVYEGYFETPEQVTEYFEARFASSPTSAGFRSPKPPAFPIIQS